MHGKFTHYIVDPVTPPTTPIRANENEPPYVSFPGRSLTLFPSNLGSFYHCPPGLTRATQPCYSPALLTSRLNVLNVTLKIAIGREEYSTSTGGMRAYMTSSRRLWQYSSNYHLQIFPQKIYPYTRSCPHLPHNCFHAYSMRSGWPCHNF